MTRHQTLATSTNRRTSQYTLTIPAPEHADADLQAALDALVAAVAPETVTGSYLTRPARPGYGTPTLSVAWRASSDLNARVGAVLICKAYGTDPETGHLHTGYGMHRRDFPVIKAGER
jgi:hypothetical protein